MQIRMILLREELRGAQGGAVNEISSGLVGALGEGVESS